MLKEIMQGDVYHNSEEKDLFNQKKSSMMGPPDDNQENVNKNLKIAMRDLVNQKIP